MSEYDKKKMSLRNQGVILMLEDGKVTPPESHWLDETGEPWIDETGEQWTDGT